MELVKLKKAITSAISNLEHSLQALLKRDEEGLLSYVWWAAADSEYALFLLFIMHKETLERSSWNSSFHQKKVEVGPSLVCARDNLKEAKKNIEANDLNNAHKKTWLARGCLLKVQDIFEKERGSDKKSFLTPT